MLEDERMAKDLCGEVVLGEKEGLVIWQDIVMIAPSVPGIFQLITRWMVCPLVKN